jgi:hypothetical protein
MDTPPQPESAESGPHIGPLVFLGLPCAVQLVVMYLLIAVDSPFTPTVHRLLANTGGILLLAGFGLACVCVVMWSVLSWSEWRFKKRARS